MTKDEGIYLEQILESISRIEKYTDGLEEGLFMSDELVQDGVIRQLQIIGEAV